MNEHNGRLSGIYAILDHDGAAARLDACLAAGVRLFQYRAKERATLETARALVARCREAGALLIVNDDLDLTLACGADGLHLGQEDAAAADLAEVRRRLSGRLLGISTHDPEQARRSVALGADYVGAGSCFPTRSKERAVPIGIEGLREIVAASRVPVAAIGGIDASNVHRVRAAGAAMAAVIAAIAGASDARLAAAQLVAAWEGAEIESEAR